MKLLSTVGTKTTPTVVEGNDRASELLGEGGESRWSFEWQEKFYSGSYRSTGYRGMYQLIFIVFKNRNKAILRLGQSLIYIMFRIMYKEKNRRIGEFCVLVFERILALEELTKLWANILWTNICSDVMYISYTVYYSIFVLECRIFLAYTIPRIMCRIQEIQIL